MKTFFIRQDYEYYLFMLGKYAKEFSVEIISFCLMPNHVHLILRPSEAKGMTKMLSEVHRKYSLYINGRNNWHGHLWQGRYYSVPLDDKHFDAAILYVEMNPVRAQIVSTPTEYEWSSARIAKRMNEFYQQTYDIETIRKMTISGKPRSEESYDKWWDTVQGVPHGVPLP